MTLVIAPALLLIFIQIRFLPYHNNLITWTQRAALLADLGLVWWLWWLRILSGREVDGRRRAFRAWVALGCAFSLGAIFFSGAIATYPGEWQENLLAKSNIPGLASFHDLLFGGPMDEVTRRRWGLFSNTLVLSGLNIYEALSPDDPDKPKGRDFVFRARGRDLRGAVFDLATLPKVDFEGADLEGASFAGAQLQGASLNNARLQRASLNDAQLQGAWILGAQLQSASLRNAQLQGARLDDAQLQGASLAYAQLQRASLHDVQLQGAALEFAQLQGLSLDWVQLQGARLDHAQLQGASLDGAQLQGASLDNAQLHGASVARAQLQGASLELANLLATDLSEALLWRTNASQGAPPRNAPSEVRLSRPTDWPVLRWIGNGEVPWTDQTYRELRRSLDSIPASTFRAPALDRIHRLDCANRDPTLAPCDPSVALPPEAAAWQKTLEAAASVSDHAYGEALADVLRGLVCSGGDDATYVVRGISLSSRLEEAGPAASALIGDLMNKDSKNCPVAAALTDPDRAKLLQIRQRIEKAPIPVSNPSSP